MHFVNLENTLGIGLATTMHLCVFSCAIVWGSDGSEVEKKLSGERLHDWSSWLSLDMQSRGSGHKMWARISTKESSRQPWRRLLRSDEPLVALCLSN